MNNLRKAFFVFSAICSFTSLTAQNELPMQNIAGRDKTSLNGEWNIIIDPTNNGIYRKVWRDPVVKNDFQFFEY